MYLALLAVIVVALAWPVPRLLPRLSVLRHIPGPSLFLWQAVSLAAVIGGLSLAPLAILQIVRGGSSELPSPSGNLTMLLVGLTVSALIAIRLLVRGHLVGTELRRIRARHRELVDLLGTPDPARAGLRVLTHPTPTAYCVPGAGRRVVLTDSTFRALAADEVDAVLAHEARHLRQRHDLVLEFFTVLHTAVPRIVRSDRAIAEVKLLIELLADRAAVAVAGRAAVGRALVALAAGAHPDAMLGHSTGELARLQELRQLRRRPGLTFAVVLVTVLVLVTPTALTLLQILL